MLAGENKLFKINTTGTACEAGTAFHSGALAFASGF